MIIITGSSMGIGRYLAERFMSDNIIVFGTYLTNPPIEKSKHFSKVDISDFNEIIEWFYKIKPELKNVVLLNCAAINYNCYAHKSDLSKWHEVIHVNLLGTFNMIRAILPFMREQNYGRIINFSSVLAQKGVAGTSAYAASKAALWGMSKSIAAESAGKNITINCLNLGYFNLGMIEQVPEELQNELKKSIPSGNFGDPEDIYKAVRFLIESNYVNGSSIDINGGLF
jgi:NAD(P)-dependent dehydrogenase (short-subunit alcohol dehydrogenase family)